MGWSRVEDTCNHDKEGATKESKKEKTFRKTLNSIGFVKKDVADLYLDED